MPSYDNGLFHNLDSTLNSTVHQRACTFQSTTHQGRLTLFFFCIWNEFWELNVGLAESSFATSTTLATIACKAHPWAGLPYFTWFIFYVNLFRIKHSMTHIQGSTSNHINCNLNECIGKHNSYEKFLNWPYLSHHSSIPISYHLVHSYSNREMTCPTAEVASQPASQQANNKQITNHKCYKSRFERLEQSK